VLHKATLVQAALDRRDWRAALRAARLSIAAGAAGGQERAGDPRAAQCAGDGRNRMVTAASAATFLYSDDGKTWVQAEVPLSSDLTARPFPSAQQGWAVGHEGVDPAHRDGGATWSKQLDGKQAPTSC
jgi:hypothetical protein